MSNDPKDNYPSGINDKVFEMNLEAYRAVPTTYNCLMRNHFQQELSTARDYEGRELLELIQNTDDAGADTVWITLRDGLLSIANNGAKPFTIEGYASIMRADQSSKLHPTYIGCKGLGFRSVLNWTSRIVIRSLLEPNSKNGIECLFSQDIATENYYNIKKEWQTLDKDVELLLDKIAEINNRPVPLAILSIPKVSEWSPKNNVTTEIELDILPNIIDEVTLALENLASSSFYLFLHNLKNLTIDVNGSKTSITCDKHIDGRTTIQILKNEEALEVQNWMIERYESIEENISVGAARRIDAGAQDHHTSYLHCFFPTMIIPGYGCILHASIELDKSRKHMLSTPPTVLEHLALVVIKLAQRVKELRKENPTWEAYDILFLDRSTQLLDNQWKPFISTIDNVRKNDPFCPSALGSYIPLMNSIRLSENFSGWVETLDSDNTQFVNVLKKGFSSRGIEITSIVDFQDKLTSYALQELDHPTRCDYIKYIAEAAHNYRGNNPISTLSIDIPLLTDSENHVICEMGYIFTGRKNEIPRILPVKIVNNELVSMLKDCLKEQYENYATQTNRDLKETDERKLAAYLRKVTNVTTTDFTDIKELLAKASMKEHTIDDDKEIIRYLYTEYQHSSDFQFRTPMPIHLLNANGAPTQICSLIYHCDDKEWCTLVKNWEEVTGDTSEQTKHFLIEVLHMASRVPLRFEPWNYNGYLTSMVDNPKQYEAEEIKSKSEYHFGKEYVVDKKWMEQNSYRTIIEQILSDKRAYEAIIKSDYKLYYKARTYIYGHTVNLTPSAYSLRKTKGTLDNYICNTNLWLGEPRFDADHFDYEQFRPVALALGAKDTEDSLSTQEIYHLIAKVERARHTDQYQYYKDLLLTKECATPPTSLKLWATLRGVLLSEKVLASDCFYADNPLPKAISDKLKLFDIGRRVGEDNVHNLFGVGKATSIFTQPLVQEEYELKELGKIIRQSILARRDMILAARCLRIRSSSSRKEQAAILNKIDIQAYSELNFTFKMPYEDYECTERLLAGEYILDCGTPYKYILVYEDTNFASDIKLIEAVAGILCHAFKLDSNDIHRKFYDILRRELDELNYIARQDYSEEYLDDIRCLLSEDSAPEPSLQRLSFDDLLPVRRTITNHEINLYHNKCLADSTKRLGYLKGIDNIGNHIERQCKEWFVKNQDKYDNIADLKKALFRHMGLPENQSAITSTPSIDPEAEQWVKSTFISHFDAQNELGERYSLLFFPKELDSIKSFYDNQYTASDKPQNSTTSEQLKLCNGSILKPTISTSTHSGKWRIHNGPKNKAAQNLQGENAEKRVYQHLASQGYAVFKASSNTDPALDDSAHYDMFYEKDGRTHYVEVKSTTDGTIHLSPAQYLFASDKTKIYDLYVVITDRLVIFENAYDNISRCITPEGYLMRVELEE